MTAPAVLAIFGPTAVGKTAVAVAVARALRSAGHDPVAISADAMQLYRGIETLTGARDALEQDELEHRLVAVLPLTEETSAGRYARLAHAEIDAALAAGRVPLVVGGTGLYLRAALTTLALRPPAPPAVRAALEEELEREGPEHLHARLTAAAPWAAERIAPSDRSRLVRTLELHEIGALERPEDGAPNHLWTDDVRHPTRLVGLVRDRDALRTRIDARIDAMLAAGAADEVRAAAAAGAASTARKAHGFEPLLAGDEDRMRRDTKRYVKRQLTWMRKLPGAELVDLDASSDVDAVARTIAAPWLAGR
ncbi:tRNA dimethylallyltransferase [Patulibacter brassicae]|uniref:tRNA dimethylallyltransferase n=1 Tax=Patulibacter brassicae TaxID=1705717 RepID=A0ABU4VE89_9ACTN|nr:tRNA dimethylallyltransferase [Patulibacter brassicae]MDX8150085.1 tRNA dimethylallyltransferase [Patulibacter brassicae]